MPRTSHRPAAFLASLALALTGLVAAGGALAPAATATTPAATVAPGTILYIKSHNIWMARGDGSGQVQVTKNGTAADPYSSPTQADDGTIVAAKSYLIVRLDRDGKQLGWFTPPTLTSSAGAPLGGVPYHVAVSPNGSTIAYSQIAYQCPIGVSCMTRYATGYTNTSGVEKANATYFKGPSWISNTRTIQDGGYLSNAMLHTLGSAPINWFNDEDIFWDDTDLGELEVSRDGKWLIALRGYDSSTHVIWYQVNGNASTQSPPALPTDKCITGNDPSFASPTLAPDGSAAAWEESDGIWIKNNLTECISIQPALRIPGGTNPSWSKVAYRAPKPATPTPTSKLKVSKAPAISGTAKVAKTLTASKGTWSPAPTKVTYQWKRNGNAIKGATKSSYKLTKTDAGTTITVTVTATRSGYTKASATSKAKAVALYNTKKPKIASKPAAKVGKTLKVSKGTWKSKPKSYSYQWYRGTKAIKGATKSSYKVTKADRGKKIRVKVTAKRTGYPKAAVYTSYTKKVK